MVLGHPIALHCRALQRPCSGTRPMCGAPGCMGPARVVVWAVAMCHRVWQCATGGPGPPGGAQG